MNKRYGIGKLNIIVIVLALAAGFAIDARAGVRADRYRNAIVGKLTEKLRADLADQSVEVRLGDVRDEAAPAARRIDFDGRALAVVASDKTSLPLAFKATLDLARESITDVSYEFVAAAAEAEAAPAVAEDGLMKGLMARIGADYKTTNIVISIDGFDAARLTPGETKYEGTGEVRIGDVEWRRITFSVVLDAATQTATRVAYDVQK